MKTYWTLMALINAAVAAYNLNHGNTIMGIGSLAFAAIALLIGTTISKSIAADREHANRLTGADLALSRLHSEYARDQIGIHELEARTAVIHATGTDPGADNLLTPGEIRLASGTACPVCGEETGATHCAGTIWWPHAITVTVPRGDVPDLDSIQWDHALRTAGLRMPGEPTRELDGWEHDATGTPVKRDKDGHVTWRAIEVDDRGRVTIARREGT